MTALITGASSGIGKDIAKTLASYGIRVVISGRNREKLEEVREEIGAKKAKIIVADLSLTDDCIRLYEEAKKYDVDILINNAGFGVYGNFFETDLDRELEMIDVNVKAVHTLMKLFLDDFIEKDFGYVLNVASAAGFLAGPFMATYYASKNYVVRLTQAVAEELRSDGSNVYVGALCPGPVSTNFGETAGVKFGLFGENSEDVAKYAVDKMFMRKEIIVPTLYMKAAVGIASKAPTKMVTKIAKKIQGKKGENNG